MQEYLTPEEIRFLTGFRALTEEQQRIVSWSMKNMELLEKLIPVRHISLRELQEILETARQRNDDWMLALAANALYRKQRGEDERQL